MSCCNKESKKGNSCGLNNAFIILILYILLAIIVGGVLFY